MGILKRPKITDLTVGRFVVDPAPDADRDSILAEPFTVEWTADGTKYSMTCPTYWDFMPGVHKMPWIARMFIRLNVLHMLRSSCVHDLLYDTQGGARPSEVKAPDGNKTNYYLPFKCDRPFADAVALALLEHGGMSRSKADIVWTVLRLFGQSAWDS